MKKNLKLLLSLSLLIVAISLLGTNTIYAEILDIYSPNNTTNGIDLPRHNIFNLYLTIANAFLPLLALGLNNFIIKKNTLKLSQKKVITLSTFISIILIELLLHIGYLIVQSYINYSVDYISFFTSVLYHILILLTFGIITYMTFTNKNLTNKLKLLFVIIIIPSIYNILVLFLSFLSKIF